MTKYKKVLLKLVIDNTISSKLKALIKKQKILIKNKITVQNQIKAMESLSKKYGLAILEAEDKILKLNNRRINVKRAINKSRNVRTDRNKDKNSNGDVV